MDLHFHGVVDRPKIPIWLVVDWSMTFIFQRGKRKTTNQLPIPEIYTLVSSNMAGWKNPELNGGF